MSIIQNDNFNIRAGKPYDVRFGPHETIQAALLAIPRAQRYNGLFFGVYDDINNLLTTEVTYFYFYGDFSDSEYKRVGKKPVDNIYTTLVSMFSSQIDQLNGFFYYNIETGFYYEKLTSNTGSISDYRQITGTGAGGDDKHLTVFQDTPLAIWIIIHNLNKYPSPTVFDSSGTVVNGKETHVDVNTMKFEFTAPFSGKVAFN